MLSHFKQMKPTSPQRCTKAIATFLITLAVGLTGPAPTWSGTSPLDETVRQDISLAHTTQQREESWDKERTALEAKQSNLAATLERAQQKVDGLLWANGQKQKEAARLKREIAQARRLTDGLSPLIAEGTRQAEAVVRQSLPFLSQERNQRLAALDAWSRAPSTKQAEKLEHLLELFTIETQFGHTSEAWQETIQMETGPVTAELLKVGRLALFYLTLDKKSCGLFNPETKAFEPLPRRCVPRVRKAIALAKRERSAELVCLPIGRIVAP